MDEFIDELLVQDRVCDTILPRLTQRYILEDSGELEPRISPLEDELDAMEESPSEQSEHDSIVEGELEMEKEAIPENEKDVDKVNFGEKKKSFSKKKVKSLFKKPQKVMKLKDLGGLDNGLGGGGGESSTTVAESNRIRASLGLPPLE
jgi:hypothetical protein